MGSALWAIKGSDVFVFSTDFQVLTPHMTES